MAWNRLPVECLQLILDHLAEDKDIHALNSLLRVNRHLCDITLPYLYEDPFSLAASKFKEEHDSISLTTINTRLAPLIRTLLASAGPLYLTDLLRNAYWNSVEDETAFLTKKSGINYLRYLRHFYPSSVNHALFHNWKAFKQNTRLVNYVKVKGLEKQFRAQELSIENNPFEDVASFIVRYLAIPLRAELTWALCFPIFEQIQSLTVPLSDLQRYHGQMHRLQSLQCINFKQDQKLDYSGFLTQQLRHDKPEVLAQRRQMKADLMESMIEFVRDHTQMFPRVLLQADCPQENTWQGSHQIAPQIYLEQLNSFLPSLVCPTFLDTTNWSQFIAKIDTTDLKLVRTVVSPRGEPLQWLERLRQQCVCNDKSFLQRCRELRKVDMISLGPNFFAWAPQEKRERQAYYARKRRQSLEAAAAGAAGSATTAFPSAALQRASLLSEPAPVPPTPPPPPQPLEEAVLRCYWEGLGTEIEDIAVSFPETLTKIVIQGPRAQFAVPDQGIIPEPRAIGETWLEPLPRLRKLAIFKLEETFRMAPLLLSRCPALEELRIQDKATAYNCDQVLAFGVPRQYPAPTSLSELGTSRLKSIDLRGWSALCFHPETLRHTPELESLVLMTEHDRFMRNIIPEPGVLLSYDYPSLQEEADSIRNAMTAMSLSQLDSDDDDNQGFVQQQQQQTRPAILRRPCWAWDWYLPNLNRLRLTSEFAFRFQFKMLAGCPQLEYLELSIAVQGDHTPDMTEEQLTGPRDYYYYTHKRVLTRADFLAPNARHGGAKGKGRDRSDAYIICPNLKSLHLLGRWSMTDEFLEFLFTTVVPNLTDVTESQCLTFTFAGWVRATSRLPHLLSASSGRKYPEEKLLQLGMTKFKQDCRTAPQYIAYEKIVDGEEQVTFVQVPGSDGIKHPRPSGVYSLNLCDKYVLCVDHYID
ncbi:hypothetical protein BGZ97_002715 [Linnemannia gamsii]|jgi:hypothetical protein|uniref:F-box domain-containing protein n=1 Tax=Linnemannia gamsii TaxID=64522 RepID=A0A9P6QUI2_9FUNG|nr:hypothetical protein BGZ97_002715 [Linnemannia gamsii]